MTSALRGRRGLALKQRMVVIGSVSVTRTRGEGVQKHQILAHVVCE